MRRTLKRFAAIFAVVGSSCAFHVVPLAAEDAPVCDSLDEWLPEELIGYVEVHDLGRQIDSLLASKLRQRFEQTALGKMLRADPKVDRFYEALDRFKSVTGRRPLDVVRDLFGREAVLGVRNNFAGPEFIVLTRTTGREKIDQALEAIKKSLVDHGKEVPDLRKTTYLDYTIHGVRKFGYTVIGDVLAFSNSPGALETVLDLAAGNLKRSASKSKVFKRAASLGSRENFVVLKVQPRFIPGFEIPRKLDNIVASLIAGGWAGALDSSDLIAAALRVSPDGLRLEVNTSFGSGGLAERYATFFPPVAPLGLTRRLEKRGVLGMVQIHRNLSAWWEKREELIEPKGVGDLAGFSQVMSIVFGGRSFEDEVLPELGPSVTLVAANQNYKEIGAKPQPSIPGMAAIFHLKNAATFSREMVSAFQTFIGIINADQAQKKKNAPRMLLQVDRVGENDIHTVDLGSAPGDGVRPGIEYNFSPSLSVAGEHVVLSSSKELARTLVEELQEMSGSKTRVSTKEGAVKDSLVVKGSALASILRDNVETFVASNMVKKGQSREEAEGEIGAALELVDFFKELRLESWKTDDGVRVRLKIEGPGWGAPEPSKPAAAGKKRKKKRPVKL